MSDQSEYEWIESNGVHFNVIRGDFSGKVSIQAGETTLEVPCEALLDFAGEFIRRKKILDLQLATARQVLLDSYQ